MFDYEIDKILKISVSQKLFKKLKSDEARWSEIRSLVGPLMETPRDVRRLASALRLIDDSVGDEVDRIDVFGFAALQSLSMILAEALHNHFDKLVIDPAVNEFALYEQLIEDRRGGKSALEKIGVTDTCFLRFEKLLNFLFPRERSASSRFEFGRICERKNFLTVTYLGNPPFRVSRADISDFWALPNPGKVRRIVDGQLLDEFISQSGRLLPHLHTDREGEAVQVLLQTTDEIVGRSRLEVSHVPDLIVRNLFLPNVERSSDRLKLLFYHLVESGDLRVTSSIVRHHMFAFGIVDGSRSEDRPLLFQEDEFVQILKSEIARYKDAIRQNNWFADGVSVDCFFTILQSGNWLEEDRLLLDLALDFQSNVSAFAALFSPPGHSFQQGTMELFVSEEKLKANIEAGEEDDDYLGLCRTRMLNLLNGVHWADL